MREEHSAWAVRAAWLGPIVTFFGAISYFLIFARYPVLRDVPWVNFPLVALGVGLSLYGAWGARRRWLASIGLAGSLLLGGLFSAYVLVVSNWLPGPTATSTALASAPSLSLQDHDGNVVKLEDYLGRKLLIVFYRGYW